MDITRFPEESLVAQRLERLAELYEQGQASDLMTRTLDKLLLYEADLSRAQLGQLRGDLEQFEQQYGIESAEFYRRFQAGDTDDRMDYVEWASLFQMAQNLEKRIALLTAEEGA
jgi:hypothetical protein